MSNTYHFELVEDKAATSSGFELRINVAVHTGAREGEITITPGCPTFGELDAQVTRLINELEKLRVDAEKRFADGPHGPISLDLG
ncbi:MAG: hypothetical protein PF480_11430 [Roseovarius sp.]|jgi:hypothetical protein|nr:hypothetical protein [Roseovarius sp.]